MKAFRYARPNDVASALPLLSATQRPKGGGFDLLDLAKRGVASPDMLVDLSGLKGQQPPMDGIDGAGDHGETVIGARVTLARIEASAEVAARCPALADAAREAATPQVRNAATLAGNLLQRPRCAYFRDPFFTDCLKRGGSACAAQDGVHDEMAVFGNAKCCAVHPSNLATALAALRAEVRIVTGIDAKGAPKWRTAACDEGFFVRPEQDATRECAVGPGELVWDVIVPAARASAYVEVNHKQSYDWAQAACCAVLDVFEGKIRGARIVLGGVAPVPWRAEGAEKAIAGTSGAAGALDAAAEAAAQGATPLRDNAHKVRLAKVVVRRAIEAALARAGR
ncbi:MAG: putative xanthine dehydrogenase YagS FAD-binding subunit [Planctomycetes bacterium]|nr:putative xanthine dehydrogenase YagS FAD-binding subunit [Planctomycetota bacterium]